MSVDGQSLLLALNAGSSSLKAKLYALGADGSSLELASSARLEGIGSERARLEVDDVGLALGAVSDHASAAEALLGHLMRGANLATRRLTAIGHRIVHGGAKFTQPVRITTDVSQQLDALGDVAPLHNPPALSVVHATAARFPRVPLYAVFDTAFFAALPRHVREYALPAEWRASRGIRRFGFHGLAHEYLARAARQHGERRRLVTLQLGHGCSAAAILGGVPVETSMGFSPLEGLIMATRPGDLDAGVLLELARRGESWQTMTHALNREAGLLGLSGASADVRELLELEAHGHEGATLALAAFCHRVVKYVGAYAAVLGGLDGIVFGGGIGENSPQIRARVCRSLGWLGVTLDAAANDAVVGLPARITSATSAVAVDVVAVDEERLIAEGVRACLTVDSEARHAS